jgi:hypothetical protein
MCLNKHCVIAEEYGVVFRLYGNIHGAQLYLTHEVSSVHVEWRVDGNHVIIDPLDLTSWLTSLPKRGREKGNFQIIRAQSPYFSSTNWLIGQIVRDTESDEKIPFFE